jgi:hypothetical protein
MIESLRPDGRFALRMRWAVIVWVAATILAMGCSDFVVTRSSFDEARALTREQRSSVALQAQRAWDGRDGYIPAKNLGLVAHATGDPVRVRVRAVSPMTVGGGVLLAIGGVFLVSGFPLFFVPPAAPSGTADFPTCFFVCTPPQLGGIIVGIGGFHALVGAILTAVGTSRETVDRNQTGIRYLP